MSNDNYSSSGPPNSGYIYKRFGSNINEDYIPEESLPSFPAGRMNSFTPQENQSGAREVQTGLVEYDSTGPGSISDLRRVQPSLNNMDNRNRVLGTIGEAPTIEGDAHNIGSKIELCSEAEYGDKKAPGHSSLGHKNDNHSKPSGGEASNADDEINQEYFGMSLVAKKFKEVYRTAY